MRQCKTKECTDDLRFRYRTTEYCADCKNKMNYLAGRKRAREKNKLRESKTCAIGSNVTK